MIISSAMNWVAPLGSVYDSRILLYRAHKPKYSPSGRALWNLHEHLVSRCVCRDVNKRPKASELLTHKFFKTMTLKKSKAIVSELVEQIALLRSKVSNIL